MRNIPVLLIASIIIMLTYGACKTHTEEIVLKGPEYFPIETGSVKYYQIDTFFYNDFTNTTDTVSNLYREEIKEKLINASGDSFYRVELSLFNKVKNIWEGRQSFSRFITGNYAIENINNKPEIKMLFPISQYKIKGSSYVWNLHMLTNEDVTNVKYISVFKSFNNDLAQFNDCVTIGLQSPEKGVVNNLREEVYAKGIGLVYRHIDQSDYLLNGNSRNGFEIFVRLKP